MTSNDYMLKELKQEVDNNNQQLDLIFNSLPQSMALVTPDFTVQRVNKNFLSLYGVSNDDVVGKRCHEACFNKPNVCEGCLVEKALHSKKTEKKIKSFPNGEICEMSAIPVLNDYGDVTHLLDIRTTITELVEKEQELERIKFAMDQSTDEFWLFDKNWKVVFVSNSASKNLGFPSHEIKGADIGKFNLINRLEKMDKLFEKVKKKKNTRIESIQFKKDGSTYPCEMNLSYFEDKEAYIYAVVRNISKRKKYENELIESRETAERASKLKSEFLANMSHEIRTPLNAIISFSNFVLEEDLDNDTKNELKSEIKTNSDYLLSIISDIIEISKIESGNIALDKKPIDIESFMNFVFTENTRLNAGRFSFNLNIDLPDNINTLNSDKNLIQNLFKHLTNNAFKYTKDGMVEIGVSYIDKKDAIRFYVQDTGIGVEMEYHAEIFEPFHQLNPVIQGTGVGLTICSGIAKALKTRIEIESQKGKGSIFYFDIKR